MRMVNIKKLLVLFIFFLLIISVFSVSYPSTAISMNNGSDDCIFCKNEENRYIIKLKETPLSLFRNVFELDNKTVFSQELNDYKDKLVSIHEQVKSKILDFVEPVVEYDDIFSFDFFKIFNGFSVSNVSENVLEKISSLDIVDRIYPDHMVSVCLDDSIPLINADDVWGLKDGNSVNVTGENVSVAVLDTGVDYTHPDLGGGFGSNFTVVDGYDFVTCNDYGLNDECVDPKTEDDDPMDDNGHGTHVTGIIVGVAPGVSIYAYKVLNKDGEGPISWVMKALERVVDPDMDDDFSDHLDVVSLSFGTTSPGDPNDPLCLAVDGVVDAGVTVVTAAGNLGNDGYNTITTPGCSRKSITVGSSTKDDGVSSSSSKGPCENGSIKPDVVAPGVSIRSTNIGGGYKTLSGTSMACPHVSGTVALMLQMHPDWSPEKIKKTLRKTAVDLGYNIYIQGFGRVDAFSAVSQSYFINVSLNISEKEFFYVNITDVYDDPVRMLVFLKIENHLPRFRFGSNLVFKAPRIINPFKDNIKCEIIAIQLLNFENISRKFTIYNKDCYIS